jgi:AAA+ superfamily predicted ATPase
MHAARERFGDEAAADPFRGLYFSADQAAGALDRVAGRPLAGDADRGGLPDWAGILAGNAGWARLQESYGLSDAELDVVLVALAPEIDLRYERVYGYLQDDVTRRRPTVDLVLDLVSRTADEKLAGRALFSGMAPLVRFGLLDLAGEPNAVAPPLLAHVVVLGEQVVNLLIGQPGPGRRLAPFVGTPGLAVEPARSVPLAPAEWDSLVGLAAEAWRKRPLRLQFRGGGNGRLVTAVALAAELRVPLLVLDLARLAADGAGNTDRAGTLARAFSAARLQEAVLYVDGADDVPGAGTTGYRVALERELAEHTGVVVLADDQAWRSTGGEPLGVLEVRFAPPGFAVRRSAWLAAIADHGGAASPADADILAASFRLGPDQIAESVAMAAQAARLAGGGAAPAGPTRAGLFAAARRQSGHELSVLTRRIEPVYGWDDLVLPGESTAQLREICRRTELRERVLEDWGFGSKLSRGRGTAVLFAGPPGTGKTMAAEVVARELGVDLFTIDLSAVISKYIGETEKNLERIFTAAGEADAILFFDEADALFGKRSEVRDAHDRYANIEVAYLLQRMEQYDGIAILATNLRQHLDDAFTRRLAFVVDFPFPADAERRRIWELALASAPLAAGVDLELLARHYQLSGGSIRNAALQAAFLAAGDGMPVGMPHLLDAVHRELRKMGKVTPGTADELPARGG